MIVNKRLNNALHILLVTIISIFILFTGSSIAHASQTSNTADNSSINSWMPNPKFQELILDNMKTQGILGQNSNVNDITKNDMKKLKWINNYYQVNGDGLNHQFDLICDGNERGVKSFSIDGLQYASNIVSLSLTNVSSNTNLYNVPAVGNYTNYQISIGDITDISPISNLMKLKYIWLFGNRISDISPILNIQNNGALKFLDLDENRIYNSSGLNRDKYTANKNDIQSNPYSGGNYDLNKDGSLDSLSLENQYAETNPVILNYNQNSYNLDINNFVKLPNGQNIRNINTVSEITGHPYLLQQENQASPLYLYPFMSAEFGGAEYKQINNTNIKYDNLPQNSSPGQLNNNNSSMYFLPTNYRYYMSVQDPNTGSFYFIPYIYGGEVIIKYIDDKGNKLADSNNLSGNIGDRYYTNAKNINGYTLTKSPDNANGTYTKDDITVTYVYSKNANKPQTQTGRVTTNYVDDKGNKLADSDNLSGNIGDRYYTNAKNINGYTLTKSP
ncbi:hypothetical protein DY124_07900, partial [Apilactobacillus micheneri]